jgi:hypothetical protein
MRRMKIVYSLTAAGLKQLDVICAPEDAPQKEPATAGNPAKPAEVEAFRHNGAASDSVEIHKQVDTSQ